MKKSGGGGGGGGGELPIHTLSLHLRIFLLNSTIHMIIYESKGNLL